MKKDTLNELFDRLQDDFNFEEPQMGHEDRFLQKLNQNKGVVGLQPKRTNWWKPLSIAASIAVICVLGLQLFSGQPDIKERVVEIAPEVSQTEFYFASLIEEQVQLLQDERSPETTQLIDDTMAQMAKLEANYKNLEQELVNGGNSKFILNAMITNFQTRIDLLKEVLNTVEEIKNLKHNTDETITI